MQTDIQEIYQNTILPLPEKEQLKLASLILKKVTSESELNGKSEKPERNGGIRELFGSASLGHSTGADNESIDADLAREYMNVNQ